MQITKFLSVIVATIFFSIASHAAVDMQELIDADKSFWELTESELASKLRIGQAPSHIKPGMPWNPKEAFSWTSNARKKITGMNNCSNFGKLKSYETNVLLKDGKPYKMEISLYNRGDAGEFKKSRFDTLMAKVTEGLKQYQPAKRKPKPVRKKIKNAEIYSLTWHTDKLNFVLSWSLTQTKKLEISKKDKNEKYRYEYMKLQISKYDPKARRTTTARVSSSSIKKNIVKEDSGDVYLKNVPMVDQGSKGYCAVATMERILKYYNIDADQHLIAQLAESSASKGTQSALMIEKLKKAGAKFGVKVKATISNEDRDYDKIIKNYRKITKNKNVKSYRAMGGREGYFHTQKQDVDNWIKAAQKHSDYKKFKASIKKDIDAGKPLAWAMFIGVMTETPALPQSSGGHMRLIIGYNFPKNTKKDGEGEILYSDSWGAGHELKRMPVGNAWTITSSLTSLTAR